MDSEIPYMVSVVNLHKILDAIQNAGAPEAFGLDFLKDLGFTSSNDRAAIKLLKFLGLLDSSGKPLQSYKEFMDQHKAKATLATRMRHAYDDLFLSDKDAQTRTIDRLKGWFKTKTGAGDAVATKMASTFKSLASYADFTHLHIAQPSTQPAEVKPIESVQQSTESGSTMTPVKPSLLAAGIGFAYRIEIHLPDTTNIETYRSIFRAIREELQG